MAKYEINASDGTTYLSIDLTQAASPIRVRYDDADEMSDEGDLDNDGIRWESTPYQTADAHHDLNEAALLALRWAYRDGGWDDDNGEPMMGDINSVVYMEDDAE